MVSMIVGYLPVQTPLLFPEFVHVVRSHEATEVCHEDCNPASLNVGLHEVEYGSIGSLYGAWVRDENGDWLVLGVCEPSFGGVWFAGACYTLF